jgi:hypothetical protein
MIGVHASITGVHVHMAFSPATSPAMDSTPYVDHIPPPPLPPPTKPLANITHTLRKVLSPPQANSTDTLLSNTLSSSPAPPPPVLSQEVVDITDTLRTLLGQLDGTLLSNTLSSAPALTPTPTPTLA